MSELLWQIVKAAPVLLGASALPIQGAMAAPDVGAGSPSLNQMQQETLGIIRSRGS